MVWKLAGSILILLASTWLGLIQSSRFSERCSQLRSLQAMLQMLESEMTYRKSTVMESFFHISEKIQNPVGIIFKKTAELLGNEYGKSVWEIWESVLEGVRNDLALDSEDYSVLLNFGKQLGITDLDGQVQNIRLVQAQLRLQEAKAEEERAKHEKLYRSLGVLGGLVVVILLL